MAIDLVTALRRRAYEMDRRGTFTTNRPTPDLLTDAAAEIERLRKACDAWMNGVADLVERFGYDREAACGPSDLLPGLLDAAAALAAATRPPSSTP